MKENGIMLEEEGFETEVILENEGTLIYPEIEDLLITPTTERQIFDHKNSYGYDTVIVDAVQLQNKAVVATGTQQIISADDEYFGLDQVIVEPIQPIPVKPQFISFYNCRLSNIDETLKQIDTSNITDMHYMFYMSSLTSINLSNFDTSNVTLFDSMFASCSNLTSVNLSNFDISNAIDISSMFSSTKKLTQLDLSHFIAPNVTNTRYMFNSCSELTYIDLSNLTFENVTDIRNMFNDCKKLMYIDLRSADFSKVTTSTSAFYNVPTSCEIIVKDQKAKDFILSVKSSMKNIKLVSEL